MNDLNEPYNYGYWHNAYFGDNWLEQPQYDQHAFFRAASEEYDSGNSIERPWDDQSGSDMSQDDENEASQDGYEWACHWSDRDHDGLIDEEDNGAGSYGECWPDGNVYAEPGHIGDDQYYDEHREEVCGWSSPYSEAWYGEGREEVGWYERGGYGERHYRHMVWGDDYDDSQTYGDDYDEYDSQDLEYGEEQVSDPGEYCGNEQENSEEDEEDEEDEDEDSCRSNGNKDSGRDEKDDKEKAQQGSDQPDDGPQGSNKDPEDKSDEKDLEGANEYSREKPEEEPKEQSEEQSGEKPEEQPNGSGRGCDENEDGGGSDVKLSKSP